MAAVEIMRDTAFVKELIRKGEVDNIREGMLRGASGGCKTFDDSLLELYADGKIDKDEALANADYANDLKLQMQHVSPPEPEPEVEDKPISKLSLIPGMVNLPDSEARNGQHGIVCNTIPLKGGDRIAALPRHRLQQCLHLRLAGRAPAQRF